MLDTDLIYSQDPKFVSRDVFPHSVWPELRHMIIAFNSGCLHVITLLTLLTLWIRAGAQGHLSSDLIVRCSGVLRPHASVLSCPTVPSLSPYCPSQGHTRVSHTGAAEAGLAELPGSSPGARESWRFEEQTGAGAGLGAGSASSKQQLGF